MPKLMITCRSLMKRVAGDLEASHARSGAFLRQALAAGRYNRAEDAVREAMTLSEERERTRAEIPAAIDSAELSVARDRGRVITEQSMRELAADVKQRGRSRLAAEQPVG